MIIEFIKHDYETILLKMMVVFGAWILVLIAMGIDLYFGIRKSKSIGETISSEGLRRSVPKVVYYYSMMTFALLFDALNPLPYYLPFPVSVVPMITIIFALALIYTEAKSVREKAEDKLRRKTDESIKELAFLMKDNKEALAEVVTFLNQKKDEKSE